jgi:phage-related protein
MSTFTWSVSYSSSKSVKPRVKQAKFGDGYSQESPDGINNVAEEWSVSFENIDVSTFTNIETFFKDHGGYIAFDWTTPDGLTARFKCREWQFSHSAYQLRTGTAKFEQVFE